MWTCPVLYGSGDVYLAGAASSVNERTTPVLQIEANFGSIEVSAIETGIIYIDGNWGGTILSNS